MKVIYSLFIIFSVSNMVIGTHNDYRSGIGISRPYTLSRPQIEVYKNGGFQVTLPDSPGIQLFAFHGKINCEFIGHEAGTYSIDIKEKTNGKWVYHNKDALLKIGDTIYYWLYVQKDNVGYRKDDNKFEVFGFAEEPDDLYTPIKTHHHPKPIDVTDCEQQLTTCHENLNITNNMVKIKEERLQMYQRNSDYYKEILSAMATDSKLGKRLIITGYRQPPMTSNALDIVKYYLVNALHLKDDTVKVLQAERNEHSITFEVESDLQKQIVIYEATKHPIPGVTLLNSNEYGDELKLCDDDRKENENQMKITETMNDKLRNKLALYEEILNEDFIKSPQDGQLLIAGGKINRSNDSKELKVMNFLKSDLSLTDELMPKVQSVQRGGGGLVFTVTPVEKLIILHVASKRELDGIRVASIPIDMDIRSARGGS